MTSTVMSLAKGDKEATYVINLESIFCIFKFEYIYESVMLSFRSCFGCCCWRSGAHVCGHLQGSEGPDGGARLRQQGWHAGRPYGENVMEVVEVGLQSR